MNCPNCNIPLQFLRITEVNGIEATIFHCFTCQDLFAFGIDEVANAEAIQPVVVT